MTPGERTIDIPAGVGVLARRNLLQAISAGAITADDPIPESNVQPASLDLRLGGVAYPMRCSFLPGSETVERKLREHSLGRLDLKGALLHPRQTYLVPLKERLALPHGVRAKANPKSSTGRIDVFTRVITDGSVRFDEIRDGYNGPLFLEIVPLSFAVRLEEGLSLNQLRLTVGQPQLSDDEILRFHQDEHPLLYRNGRPVPSDQLQLANGLFLSLDLKGRRSRRVGYKARATAPGLDLAHKAPVDPFPYFEPVRLDAANQIILTANQFYLLMSEEAVCIPPQLASEMTAYDPTSGELRTHYAGFFDPGFGFAEDDSLGSRAALEVRAHDVNFMIEQGQKVCKLTFDRMIEKPDVLYGSGIRSNYQFQEETLGKFFRRSGRSDPEAVEGEPEQPPLPMEFGEA